MLKVKNIIDSKVEFSIINEPYSESTFIAEFQVNIKNETFTDKETNFSDYFSLVGFGIVHFYFSSKI